MLSAVRRQNSQLKPLITAQNAGATPTLQIIIGITMKNKPKKLAAVLELSRQELKYLSRGVEELAKVYISHCSRDFNTEDLHESVKKKLEIALGSFE